MTNTSEIRVLMVERRWLINADVIHRANEGGCHF